MVNRDGYFGVSLLPQKIIIGAIRKKYKKYWISFATKSTITTVDKDRQQG